MNKILISLAILFSLTLPLFAEDSVKLRGRVTEVNEVECEEIFTEEYSCYSYEVYVSDLDETVGTIVSMLEETENTYTVGDSVFVESLQDLDGNDTWSITGYVRGPAIFIWSLIFLALAFFVGGRKSFGSILSLILSFVLIYFFTVPNLLRVENTILLAYFAIFLILTLGMYLSHGFKKQTTIALLSTFIGVVIVSIVSILLIRTLRIDGMGEETSFLLSTQIEGINIQRLFFISILIATVGVLDDVAIGQVTSMYEIYLMDKNISSVELFKKTMNVGREHVASMVNTLFIVYAGSSLSLVMLMYLSNRDIGTLVSIDMITEEIARTLAISIALLLVVPISTFISSRLLTKKVL